jgi:stringent starvation protein B
MTVTPNATKLADFNRLVGDGPVQVHLDPRVANVVVPEELRAQFRLVLDFWLPRGARDTVADAWGLRETLVFSMRRVKVAVPWEAVFWMRQLVGDGSAVYPYSVPLEMAQELGQQKPSPLPPLPVKDEPVAEPAPKPRPKLRLVRNDDDDGDGT